MSVHCSTLIKHIRFAEIQSKLVLSLKTYRVTSHHKIWIGISWREPGDTYRDIKNRKSILEACKRSEPYAWAYSVAQKIDNKTNILLDCALQPIVWTLNKIKSDFVVFHLTGDDDHIAPSPRVITCAGKITSCKLDTGRLTILLLTLHPWHHW